MRSKKYRLIKQQLKNKRIKKKKNIKIAEISLTLAAVLISFLQLTNSKKQNEFIEEQSNINLLLNSPIISIDHEVFYSEEKQRYVEQDLNILNYGSPATNVYMKIITYFYLRGTNLDGIKIPIESYYIGKGYKNEKNYIAKIKGMENNKYKLDEIKEKIVNYCLVGDENKYIFFDFETKIKISYDTIFKERITEYFNYSPIYGATYIKNEQDKLFIDNYKDYEGLRVDMDSPNIIELGDFILSKINQSFN